MSIAEPSHLEHTARRGAALALPRREYAVEMAAGALFLLGAVAIAVADGGSPDAAVLVALVLAFAFTHRARFDVGGGYVSPTELVFVSVLLLEPPGLAPAIALAGVLLSRVPDLATRSLHPSRLLLLPADCLYALGPAFVLVVAGVHGPHWNDWPIYVLALAAQFAVDFGSGALRGWVALGVPPALQLRTLGFVWAIDAALAPVGLLAAFASTTWRFAFLGVLPLAGLLVVLSRERARRLATELAAARARDSLIADASHELQTPLAVLSGLIASLGREPAALSERNAGRQAAMERQAGQLRFLVGQFVDYARIKAGQDLSLAQRPVAVGPLLHGVAELWRPEVDVQLPGGAWDELAVFADEARLHRVLMSLVANAVKHGSPDGPVWLSAQVDDGDQVLITVVDHGPGMPADLREVAFDELRLIDDEGMGVGLFVARANLRAQGGEIALQEAAGGGLVAEVRVPVAPA